MGSRASQNIRVTWQGGILITSLIIMGAVGVFLADISMQADQRGNGSWKTFCWTTLSIGAAGCALALWSRLSKVRDADALGDIIHSLGTGLALLAGAVLLTLISHTWGIFSAFGKHWFLLPMGLYTAGLVTIASVMNPETDE